MKNHNVIRAGARVGCERLSLIRFSYLGFDGAIHDDGEIMVMDAAAENVLRIFNKLRERGECTCLRGSGFCCDRDDQCGIAYGRGLCDGEAKSK
jgi:hypothetical protein